MALLILGAFWFVLTTIVGTLMYASQVGPHEAVSNLSLWAKHLGIENPPEWLKAKSADRYVRRRAAIALAGLLLFGGFLGGMAFDDFIRPPTAPSLPAQSNRWEPLSPQEVTALRDGWRNLPAQRLGVLCAIPACADLAESIYDVAKDLSWPALYSSTYFQDNGIQAGLEIWSYPERVLNRDKIAVAIEHATKGRLKISSHMWPAAQSLPPDVLDGINIVIGRLK